MAALDTSSLGSERVESDSAALTASFAAASPAFATRWTTATLALLDELGSGGGEAPSLGHTAAVLARHGARLIAGTQCAISVVPPDRPNHFSLLAGEGEWAAALVGGEWPLEGTINGRAMLSGAPVETTDAQAESSTPYVLAPGDIETGRVVPLRLRAPLSDGRVAMGAIGFWRTGHQTFTDEERLLIDTFGNLAAVLLHREEVLGTATRATQRLESAVDVAVAGASLVPESVIRRLLERSLDAVHADRASLCRVQGTTMTVLDVVDRERPVDSTGDRFEQPWHPAVQQAVIEGRPVVIGPFAYEGLTESMREAVRDSERTMFVPLLAEGQAIALLSLMRRDNRPFSEADVSTVQLIGSIASLSLRNAERYSEAERAHRRSLLALLEITRHVDDAHGLSAFFRQLTESVAQLVRASGAAFFEIGPGETLSLVRHPYNIDPAVEPAARARTIEQGSTLWRVVYGDEAFRSTDPRDISAWLPGLQMRSAIAVSWRAGDRVLGSLAAFDSLDPGGFTDEDIWVLRFVALAAGLVLQHKQVEARGMQLAREASEPVHAMSVVQHAAQALVGAIDLDDVFRQVVQSAAHVVTPPASSARRATLLRVDGNRATIIAEYDEAGTRTDVAVYNLDEHPQMRRVLDGDEVVTIDLTTDDVADPTARQMRAIGVLSSALTPVRVDDKVVAILRVSARDPEAFGAAQQGRLRAIANVAGLAMGNAERYQFAQREALRRAELENVKSEFLRLASHELRAPIGLLRGYLSMFEDGTVPSVTGQARDTLPILLSKVAQMGRMVDDMLETARLEEGHVQLHIQRADLGSLVRRSVETVRPMASAGHSLRVRIPEAPVHVTADPQSVETIVTNLLDNAIKYSPEGGLIECVVKAGLGSASVSVRDHGLGIAEDDMPKLFSRFGRIVTPENSSIMGTGLGLHLARELARMQGGTIKVRSRHRQGSVFTLRLPRDTAA